MLVLGHRQNITEIFLGKETFNYIIMFKPPCNIIYLNIYIYNIANVLELLHTIINPFLTHVIINEFSTDLFQILETKNLGKKCSIYLIT